MRRQHHTALLLVASFLFLPRSGSRAQERSQSVRLVRQIQTGDLGAPGPAGVTFSRTASAFYRSAGAGVPGSRTAYLTRTTPGVERRGVVSLEVGCLDPLNTAFDDKARRWLALVPTEQQWVEVATHSDGSLDPDSIRRFDARVLNLEQPRGITVDPESGLIYLLDGAEGRILRVETPPEGSLEAAFVSEVALGLSRVEGLRGLAIDASSGHLHVWSGSEQRLYELSLGGEVIASRDLSFLGLNEIEGLSFASSGDSTDDPSQMSLYVSARRAPTGTSDLLELSLIEPPAPLEPDSSATLVQTIDTSAFVPPSPDPSGIAYLGSTGRLLMSDGEVEEMSIYQGVNVFDLTLTGIVVGTFNTLDYSDEPTGLAFNPNDFHLFFSDDNSPRRIYELDPGPDGLYATSDDSVTFFNTSAFGSSDPEGVAYDTLTGALFIADGVNAEIYRVAPGANGVFDGVQPEGDDLATSFDTESLGVIDPEGIEFDAANDALYIVGRPPTQLAHVTTDGTLLRVIDISAADAIKPAGLALGPGSQDLLSTSLYIADRGVDNNSNPDENDGKIYEMSLPPFSPGNMAPSVSAGPDQDVVLPYNVLLDGTVFDDGFPSPPSLTTAWSQVSGPGLVDFLDATAVDTSARFFTAGTYVLRLTAADGELVTIDDTVITVTGTGVSWVDVTSVGASADDAEEDDGGDVMLASSDLELGDPGGAPQTVGIRFNGLAIPQGSSILGAYVQFEADETGLGASSILIEGEGSGHAQSFTSQPGNVSTRPRTAASVGWSPTPWTTVGEAGFDQRTPNIAPVLQEIVDGSGWSSGNSAALILTGSGVRTARSYDGSSSGAPVLHVDYVPPLANEMDLFLSNETVTDSRLYVACNTITAGAAFSVVAPGSLILRAGQAVILQNGFSVGSGASLTIQLDPNCTLNTAPSVIITSPEDGSSFDEGESISFAGEALDAEEGDLSAGLNWFSDRDGPIGTGVSFSTTVLTVGTHTITASVSDGAGAPAQSSITLTVDDP